MFEKNKLRWKIRPVSKKAFLNTDIKSKNF